MRACDELSMAATRLTLANNHHGNNQELLMESFLLSEYEVGYHCIMTLYIL